MKLEKTHMKTLADLREQIQEDILTYIESIRVTESWKTMGFRYKAELCQLVGERFNQYTYELR